MLLPIRDREVSLFPVINGPLLWFDRTTYHHIYRYFEDWIVEEYTYPANKVNIQKLNFMTGNLIYVELQTPVPVTTDNYEGFRLAFQETTESSSYERE